MRTITFYSYKGGVGRTLAAANFAVYLAKLGLRTVLIDFDLEAPGIDAKFPSLKVPEEQRGILDYILDYQLKNHDPGNITQLCLQVPVESSDSTLPLWLIPAGQYLSEEYYRKLSLLDWSFIFSEKRDGVTFFQQFLAHIEQELQANFLIIDSRTGITEIAGLCTQQLADEVVMLSSLSSESIRVTKHIKKLIQQSRVAKTLEKSIDIKVVISRVPKPEDLVAFKERYCKVFEIEETKLFFLFSCPALEQEEFLAISASQKNEELVSNYVRLFYGLNLELADKNIRAEIERISRKLLLIAPEESEQNILELVALYPHPEVYRAAMHFFSFTRNDQEMTNYAWKLFELLPNDEEVQNILAKRYLDLAMRHRSKYMPVMIDVVTKDAIRAIEPSWKKGKLAPIDLELYADLLADAKQYSESLKVVLPLCKDEKLNTKIQVQVRLTAVRSASKLGQNELAEQLAVEAVDICQESEGSSKALEIASQLLNQYFSKDILEKAVFIARQLNLLEELEQALKNSPEIIKLHTEPKIIEEIRNLELYELAHLLSEYDDVPF